jgi:hypothetical protein
MEPSLSTQIFQDTLGRGSRTGTGVDVVSGDTTGTEQGLR